MALEALSPTTFISDLSQDWPISGDPKSQGDDHIRLVKGVLRNTFPNATKPVFFPTSLTFSGNQTVSLNHDNSTLIAITAGADVTYTLPAVPSNRPGWSVNIIKGSVDAFGVNVVTTPAGNIKSQVGLTASIRVGQLAQPATFFWNGGEWYCWKMAGGLIGEVVTFDGISATIPYGFLPLDGYSTPGAYIGTFVAATFAELYAALGNSNVLRDRHGRTDAGKDYLTAGRLQEVAGGAAGANNAGVVGAAFGDDLTALVAANLPAYTPTGGITNGAITTTLTDGANLFHSSGVAQVQGGGTYFGFDLKTVTAGSTQLASTFTGDAQGGTSQRFSITQPTIITRKLIRAC